MSLRAQFKSLLEPELMERLVDQTLNLKIHRFSQGQAEATIESVELGPLPKWFTIYQVKLALWDMYRLDDNSRNPIFSPSLVFLGLKDIEGDTYTPVEVLWKIDTYLSLLSPEKRMTGPPDDRFVDSSGGQKSVGKNNRVKITLTDIFELDKGKQIPDIHVFLYTDLIDRVVGPRPLGERDVYGRIIPYFPYLDPLNLPDSTGIGAITPIIIAQADQVSSALNQAFFMEKLLVDLEGQIQLPKLDGVKFIRWSWNNTPDEWEGPSILFFGTKVTHERPFMRFFPGAGQPLTKIHVKGILPIPDLADPNLLMTWKQDKNPDVGKDCLYMKLSIDETGNLPLYATLRVWNDGTSDLLIQPPKQKRLLDPYSDLENAPEALDNALSDLPYLSQEPTLAQTDVVLKIRLDREDAPITKQSLQKRLQSFSSVFQEIPALPDEQPLAMLRYKGVSNFSSEDRIFAFLTQIAAHEIIAGETKEDTWASRVADEFQLPIDQARKQVVSWLAQRNEYVLAVPETKDFILNKNPGVDIAIHAQHPIYNFHIYRAESFQIYKTITNLLGLLITAPADRFTGKQLTVAPKTLVQASVKPVAKTLVQASVKPVAKTLVQTVAKPVIQSIAEPVSEPVDDLDEEDIPEMMRQNRTLLDMRSQVAKESKAEIINPLATPAAAAAAAASEATAIAPATVVKRVLSKTRRNRPIAPTVPIARAVAPAPEVPATPVVAPEVPVVAPAPEVPVEAPPTAEADEVPAASVVAPAAEADEVPVEAPPAESPAAESPEAPPAPEASEENEDEDFSFPNNENIPAFMRRGGAKKKLAIPEGMTEDDVRAAEAFQKPTDVKAIKVKKYYIDRLKLADADIFNYSTAGTDERGYVSHCAANETRQPIVLDQKEYNEMRTLYEDDDDLDFVVYPDDTSPSKFPRRQPKPDENSSGAIEDKPFPSEDNKEIITLVKYGSKPKRVNYYFCPRLFCIRDRLMVRYTDFKKSVDRKGAPKPANSCPFCKGILVDPDSFDKDSDRDPNMTVLQRKTRPGSDTERQIYIGFLEKKKNPSGMSMPCCFADPNERFTSSNNEEFEKLGLRPISAATKAKVQPVLQTAVKPAVQATVKPLVEATVEPALQTTVEPTVKPAKRVLATKPKKTIVEPVVEVDTRPIDSSYEPDFFRVIEGVSVKAIVDATRIPLDIIVPKAGSQADPKSGPQIGLLPEALDRYFEQDSTSDKFAARDIVRKLKPTAKGFLRLGVDNSDINRSLLSALVPFFLDKGNAARLIDDVISTQITARRFLQMNSGNLVNEFFNKCSTKTQNEMRNWASKELGIDGLKSSNIPAIERLMNSYECFKNFLNDPTKKKDMRMFYQAFAEPNFIRKGLLFIILEVSIEESTIKKGDKSEFKRDIKFERVRYPPYPLTEDQKQSSIAFLVHYTRVTRDKYQPEKKIFKTYGWEPLIYVDGITTAAGSRHRPKKFFQRSEEADWPPIVKKRVKEFFDNCSNKRGPFTSQFGFDPYSLIGANDLIKGIEQIQPNGIIRDSYNHMVGVGYKIGDSSEIVSIPISDDGSMHFNRNIFFDWDDFKPAKADDIVEFYRKYLLDTFRPFANGYKPRRLRVSPEGEVVGVELQNRFVIPASKPRDLAALADLEKPERLDMFEWDNNKTIAYDSKMRKEAFDHAKVKDPETYIQLQSSSIQDEIEDVYQHLRLSFSSWLARPSAGKEKRDKIEAILKNTSMPLYEKRKRLDILLESEITGWLEPSESEDTELGFLRVDCLIQGEDSCSGRCKWDSENDSGPKKCRIHTPATISPNGLPLKVPRLLYLRLIDELIRYSYRREEIFLRRIPRLTIRQDAQRIGDQYIVPEGSPDWNSWWEMLRSEWINPDVQVSRSFDEQFESVPEV